MRVHPCPFCKVHTHLWLLIEWTSCEHDLSGRGQVCGVLNAREGSGWLTPQGPATPPRKTNFVVCCMWTEASRTKNSYSHQGYWIKKLIGDCRANIRLTGRSTTVDVFIVFLSSMQRACWHENCFLPKRHNALAKLIYLIELLMRATRGLVERTYFCSMTQFAHKCIYESLFAQHKFALPDITQSMRVGKTHNTYRNRERDALNEGVMNVSYFGWQVRALLISYQIPTTSITHYVVCAGDKMRTWHTSKLVMLTTQVMRIGYFTHSAHKLLAVAVIPLRKIVVASLE